MNEYDVMALGIMHCTFDYIFNRDANKFSDYDQPIGNCSHCLDNKSDRGGRQTGRHYVHSDHANYNAGGDNTKINGDSNKSYSIDYLLPLNSVKSYMYETRLICTRGTCNCKYCINKHCQESA